MHDMKHEGRQADAKLAGITKVRSPLNGNDEDWNDGSKRQQADGLARLFIKNDQNSLLVSEIGLEPLPEWDSGDSSPALHYGQEQIKQESGPAIEQHAAEKLDIEKAQAFDPDQRRKKKREEADHPPVVGHTQAINKSGPSQPGIDPVDSVLQQAANHISKEQQVEHFPRSGGRLFPEGELQTTDQHRQHGWQPGGANGQQEGITFLSLPLFVSAVVRQQSNRTGEQGQCKDRT